MVICASQETSRPINKRFDHDNYNIYEEAHDLIASDELFSTLILP